MGAPHFELGERMGSPIEPKLRHMLVMALPTQQCSLGDSVDYLQVLLSPWAQASAFQAKVPY